MLSAHAAVPFADPKSEIRLVTILPGEAEDDIQCRLEVVSFAKALKYSALSYRWGDPTISVPIYLQGEQFHVTTNLAAALRHFRRLEAQQKMWIDAICINQQDDNERSAQVSFMGDIYRKASVVNVWLGEAAPGSDRAMAFLLALSNRVRNDKHMKTIREEPSLFSAAWQRIPTGRWVLEELTTNRQIWEDLSHLFAREYWGRVWVMQELSLANTISLICGDFRIRDFHLHKAIDLLYRVQANLPHGMNHVSNSPFGMSSARIWVRSGLRTSLYRFLVFGQYMLASDPRDKIFAVLGLVNDPEMPQYHVDYSKAPERVYKEVARMLLVRQASRHFLSLVLSRPRNSGLSNMVLPSCKFNEILLVHYSCHWKAADFVRGPRLVYDCSSAATIRNFRPRDICCSRGQRS